MMTVNPGRRRQSRVTPQLGRYPASQLPAGSWKLIASLEHQSQPELPLPSEVDLAVRDDAEVRACGVGADRAAVEPGVEYVEQFRAELNRGAAGQAGGLEHRHRPGRLRVLTHVRDEEPRL